ncbi:unnamed protein product [Nippostrongylus brasiliensis]|uniref:DOMON domain-containing protein n=1 Tax=Nippostrongylus brasiliensis TaxID=27835 RepID=A0A0N4Y9C3_NIPBR|nr:unnamed protein product [Nippostrongylus brasiliensis]
MQLAWFVLLVVVAIVDSKSLTANAKNQACSYENAALSLQWTYSEASANVVFKLTAKSSLKNFWSGVYFGQDEPVDSIGASVRNGQIGVVDGHVEGDRLEMDNITNVQSLQFDLQNDVLSVEFARPSFSNDPNDVDLSNCATFFFPLEVVELDAAGKVLVPERMETLRVCDIPVTCVDRNPDVAKRSDASVCEYTNGKSTVSWKAVGDDVEFLIGQEVRKGNWWSAIGVGQSMEDETGCVTLQISVLGGQWTGKFDVKKHNITPEAVVVCGIELCKDVRSDDNKKLIEEKVKKTADAVPTASEATPEDEGLLKKPANRAIDEAILEHPAVIRQQPSETSGTEPAINETSIFASAAESIDAVPEGSGQDITADVGSGDEQDAEIKNALTASSDNAANLTIVDGEFNHTAIALNETVVDGPITAESASAIDSEPLTAEIREEAAPVTTTLAPEALPLDGADAVNVTEEATALNETESATAKPLVLSKTMASDVARIVKQGCTEGHTDLAVCEGYFADYLAKVNEWANKHNQLLKQQMWKACTLLSQVKHVPTMCCTAFRNTCGAHLLEPSS